MIRVIGGKYKNSLIYTSNSKNLEPTKNRVREAIFSAIRNENIDAIVLDLFAGSGALGIESLSRGSKFVYFNDIDSENSVFLKKTLQNLNIFSFDIKNLDYLKALEEYKNNKLLFNIVFLDPPYKDLDFYYNSINYLIKNNLINKKSVLVLETNTDLELTNYVSYFNSIKLYKYGYSKVYILKNK